MSDNFYYYKEGAGVTFYNPDTDEAICHTFKDRGLILNDVNVTSPVPKTVYIDIPGRDGSIDLTEALGGVKFEDRNLNITLTDLDYKRSVGEAFALLQRQIDGRRVKVILDKMPAYYFIGRVTAFSDPEVAGWAGTTTITVQVEPYRYSIYSANDPWLWDPFNFLTDMAIDAGSYPVNGTLTKNIYVGMNDVIPTITVDSEMTLEFNGKTITLHPGTNRDPDILLKGDQNNVLVFRGNGTVTIDYLGGRF